MGRAGDRLRPMKTLATLVLGFLCLGAEGQILVFKQAVTHVITGDGVVTKQGLSGYTLAQFDSNGPTVVRIDVDVRAKNFMVNELASFSYVQVRAPRGQSLTVLTEAFNYLDSNANCVEVSETCKGVNYSVDIGLFSNVMVPKSMSLLGRQIYTDDYDQNYIDEVSGVLVLDVKQTSDANFFEYSITDVQTNIRSNLVSKGYTETH